MHVFLFRHWRSHGLKNISEVRAINSARHFRVHLSEQFTQYVLLGATEVVDLEFPRFVVLSGFAKNFLAFSTLLRSFFVTFLLGQVFWLDSFDVLRFGIASC